jgi:hypothetical protein
MKTVVWYEGVRTAESCKVVRWRGSKKAFLPRRLGVRNHSPAGFNWGYNGSGPAQLALALCLEVVPESDALKVYQSFKFSHVGRWSVQRWTMTYEVLAELVNDLLKKRVLRDAPTLFPETQVLGNG